MMKIQKLVRIVSIKIEVNKVTIEVDDDSIIEKVTLEPSEYYKTTYMIGERVFKTNSGILKIDEELESYANTGYAYLHEKGYTPIFHYTELLIRFHKAKYQGQ